MADRLVACQAQRLLACCFGSLVGWWIQWLGASSVLGKVDSVSIEYPSCNNVATVATRVYVQQTGIIKDNQWFVYKKIKTDNKNIQCLEQRN